MNKELILVLDFGGQYNQLIARRVRECNVYCEVHPYNLSVDKIREMNPKGIIFTGGPNSVYGENSPLCDKAIFELGIPVLGICYGSQLMSHVLGGSVATAPVSEYGKTVVKVDTTSKLFSDVHESTIVWMSHTDYIERAPENFKIVGTTPVCPVAAMECEEKNLYAVQFHPEVMHTQEGTKMISNFLYNACKCSGDWKMDSFVEKTIEEIREKVGNGKVLCALSGGVDIIQLREKKSNARRIIELGHKIRQLTSMYNALFIVNDRVDIAKIVKADGVHLGQDDVEIDYAKEILGNDKIIGISTHERKQAIKAVEQGADYIGVGPVFETPTKPGRKSVGLDYVKWASENVIDIPFYAIGGINQENVRDVIEFGAKNIAVVRAIINATSPKEATIKFKECLNGNIINA